MNKKRYLSLMLIISIIVCMMPFNSVKAATSQSRLQVNKSIIWSNMDLGTYNNYAYFTTGSDTLNVSEFNINVSGLYKTANVITIGFNDPITGEIRIDFDASLSGYQLIYVEDDHIGAFRWSGSNAVVFASLINCTGFDLYMFSNNQYTSSNCPKVGTISFVRFDLGSDEYSSYQIPVASLPAYMFPCDTMPDLVYNHGDLYPTINIDYTRQEMEHSKRLYLNHRNYYNNSIYWVFFSKKIMSTGDFDVIADNGVYYSFGNIGGVQGQTSTSETFMIYRFQFYTDDNTTSGHVYLDWLDDQEIIPVYLGTKADCPSDLRGICGFGDPLGAIADNTDDIESLLTSIYNALIAAGDQGQTSQDINDVTDDLNDVTSDIDAIEADIDDLFDSHITNIDLDDYDIFDDMVNTNMFFKNYLDDVFSNLRDFKAIIIVPVIVTVMMIMIGWVF